MLRRWLPYPALTLGLFAMWLLLMQSVSPGQLLLGSVVAILGTWAMAALRPRPAIVRNWRTVIKLALTVGWDILRSNLAVASIILSRRRRQTSGFLPLHLELRSEHGLAVLALIITATPGTAWVQFDRATGMLLIHVFDLVDEEGWVRLLKTRYESQLMAIFES